MSDYLNALAKMGQKSPNGTSAIVSNHMDNQPKAIDESLRDDIGCIRSHLSAQKALYPQSCKSWLEKLDRIEQALTQLGEWRTIPADQAPYDEQGLFLTDTGHWVEGFIYDGDAKDFGYVAYHPLPPIPSWAVLDGKEPDFEQIVEDSKHPIMKMNFTQLVKYVKELEANPALEGE